MKSRNIAVGRRSVATGTFEVEPMVVVMCARIVAMEVKNSKFYNYISGISHNY